MEVITTICAVLLVAIVMAVALVSFITRPVSKNKCENILRETFDCVFCLIGNIKKERPEDYVKVAKALDTVVNKLMEVEKTLQDNEGV